MDQSLFKMHCSHFNNRLFKDLSLTNQIRSIPRRNLLQNLIKYSYFSNQFDLLSENSRFLNGKKHFEKINAIYHPATYSPERFDADLIWLASDDFSVSVWSLSLRCALISFFNHSAPVQRFGICPLR